MRQLEISLYVTSTTFTVLITRWKSLQWMIIHSVRPTDIHSRHILQFSQQLMSAKRRSRATCFIRLLEEQRTLCFTLLCVSMCSQWKPGRLAGTWRTWHRVPSLPAKLHNYTLNYITPTILFSFHLITRSSTSMTLASTVIRWVIQGMSRGRSMPSAC